MLLWVTYLGFRSLAHLADASVGSKDDNGCQAALQGLMFRVQGLAHLADASVG